MKIAITAQGAQADSMLDPRFGRSAYFLVYDDVTQGWDVLANSQNINAAQGAGIQAAATIVNAGCTMLLCGHCGPKAFTALHRAGVSVYAVEPMSVQQAVEHLAAGTLSPMQSADVEGHW
jgi:predicted Fe-Mo cluster-binding NifX family protein